MKVLIAGSTGFIGKNLRIFLNEHKIATISMARSENNLESHNTSNSLNKTIFFRSLQDIESDFRKQHIDFVINLAVHYSPIENPEYLEKAKRANILFFSELANFCIRHQFPLITFGTYLQELPNLDVNQSYYIYSKRYSSSLLKSLCELRSLKYLEIILNDSYGTHDSRRKILYEILKSQEDSAMPATLGQQFLNLLHVEDICNGIYQTLMQLSEKTLEFNQTIGLRSSSYITLRELAQVCETVVQRKININWGELPYRGTEIFQIPPLSPILQNWTQSISLFDGIQRIAPYYSPYI